MAYNITITNTPHATSTERIIFQCTSDSIYGFTGGGPYSIIDHDNHTIIYGSVIATQGNTINITANVLLQPGMYIVDLRYDDSNFVLVNSFAFIVYPTYLMSLDNTNFVSINDNISFNCTVIGDVFGMETTYSVYNNTTQISSSVGSDLTTLKITSTNTLTSLGISAGTYKFDLKNGTNILTSVNVTVYSNNFILNPTTPDYATVNVPYTFNLLTHNGNPTTGTYQLKAYYQSIPSGIVYNIGSPFMLTGESSHNVVGSISQYGVFTLLLIDQSTSTNVLSDFNIIIEDPISVIIDSGQTININVSTNNSTSIQFVRTSGSFAIPETYSVVDSSGNPYPSTNSTNVEAPTTTLTISNLYFSNNLSPQTQILYLQKNGPTSITICEFTVNICPTYKYDINLANTINIYDQAKYQGYDVNIIDTNNAFSSTESTPPNTYSLAYINNTIWTSLATVTTTNPGILRFFTGRILPGVFTLGSMPYFSVWKNVTVSGGMTSLAGALQLTKNNGDPFYFQGNVTCFNYDTKILCENDIYRPIQDLKKGDIVKTYKYGYRKIDMIGKNKMVNNPDSKFNCMYKTGDLIITGGHSILVDSLTEDQLEKYKRDNIFQNGDEKKIDDKYLLLASYSDRFEKILDNNTYTYYHFTLENDGNNDARYGVWADGILTETPSKNYYLSKQWISIN